ncbi:hypothetical protein EVAR_45935_1 [Eumeta japonica]|uniref:Uncharacterized protein n=1 Tax=Eumeta variegata TaxID=151549 RepID=A0A4C1W8P7_EUMVA|nr:hypothetical protein EVAR_45935_1 [Eumeta japonica]
MDSSLMLERSNLYNRFAHYNKYNFCIDYEYVEASNKFEFIWVGYEPLEDENDIPFTAPILILSAIFLGLVAVVHVLIPKRSISQFIVQRYATSQFCGFALLAIMQIVSYINKEIVNPMCKPVSIVIYYFFMASFLWLNVMSYDIWWATKFLLAEKRNRRSESKSGDHVEKMKHVGEGLINKFNRKPGLFSKKTLYKYSACAFGLPLAMSTAIAVVDYCDLSDYPYIIKPNFGSKNCFFVGN